MLATALAAALGGQGGQGGGGRCEEALPVNAPEGTGSDAGSTGGSSSAACGSSGVSCADVGGSGAGGRVFYWGQRAAFPACEATGDSAPQADVTKPIEVAWFRHEANRRGCRWRQIAFGPSFGVARTDAGELYVWGSVRRDGMRHFAVPRELHFDVVDGEVIEAGFRDVQCSESAVWALTADGTVVVWERVSQSLSPERISGFACQPSKGGASFSRQPSTGSESLPSSIVPRRSPLRGGRVLSGLDQPVRAMSIGPTHGAFLMENGEVYCIGGNRSGECGVDPSKHGEVVASVRRQIFPRHSMPIAAVQCGRNHTVVINAEGQALAWGDDSKIQLGLGDTRSNMGDERPWSGSRGYLNFMKGGEGMAPSGALRGGPDSPSFSRAPSTSAKRYSEFAAHFQWKPAFMMDIPLEFSRQPLGTPYPPPDDIVCGDDFTILIARDSPDWYAPEEETNRLFCAGENGKGQCGRSLQSTQQTFAATRLPRCTRTLSTSCGSAHCVAMLLRTSSRKIELWSWGSNEHGQAGGSKVGGSVCPSSRLRLPRDAQLEAASCGFSSSAAICTDRQRRRTSGKADEKLDENLLED